MNLKDILKGIEAKERELDAMGRAPEDLALASLSDAELEAFANPGEGEPEEYEKAFLHYGEFVTRYLACRTAEEAKAIYLGAWPGTVNFPAADLANFYAVARQRSTA